MEVEKKVKRKMKKYYWLIGIITTILVSMWIYGTTSVYFPDPLYIGFGQYIDVAVGIILVSLLLSGIIVKSIFKKNKKR